MKNIKNCFLKFETIIVTIPMFLLCILIVIQVITRSLFSTGIHWLEEFGRYVLIYSTFIGASIAIKSDEHPRMTAITIALPYKFKHIVNILGDLVCATILLVLDYFAWKQVLNVFELGTKTSTLPIPMWTIYAVFPIAMISMFIRYIHSAKENFKLLRNSINEEREDGGL